jgi:hypothetical protein
VLLMIAMNRDRIVFARRSGALSIVAWSALLVRL